VRDGALGGGPGWSECHISREVVRNNRVLVRGDRKDRKKKQEKKKKEGGCYERGQGGAEGATHQGGVLQTIPPGKGGRRGQKCLVEKLRKGKREGKKLLGP